MTDFSIFPKLFFPLPSFFSSSKSTILFHNAYFQNLIYLLAILLPDLPPLNDITLPPVTTYRARLSLFYFLPSAFLLLPFFLRCSLLTSSRHTTFVHYYITLIPLYVCSILATIFISMYYLLMVLLPLTASWLEKCTCKFLFALYFLSETSTCEEEFG